MNGFTGFLVQLIVGVPTDVVTIGVIGVIAILFFMGGKQLFRAFTFEQKLRQIIEKIRLVKPTDEFKLLGFFKSTPEIKPLAEEFQELILTAGNTQNSEAILSEENILKSIDIDEDSLANRPGIFTALGIAGTFFGILQILGKKLDDADVLGKGMVDQLLNGAGVAFVTSIIGIVASVSFLGLEKFVLGRFRKTLFKLQFEINNKLQRITPESILTEIKDILEEQKEAMNTMAQDISTSIGDAIKESITNELNKGMENIAGMLKTMSLEANKSGADVASEILGNVKGVIENFGTNLERFQNLSEMQNTTLDKFKEGMELASLFNEDLVKAMIEMKAISENLINTSDKLKDMPPVLEKLSNSLGEFNTTIKSQMEMIAETVTTMKDEWKEERTRLNESSEKLKENLEVYQRGIKEGLETTMSKFDDELSRAGQYIASWLDDLNTKVGAFDEKLGSFNDVIQNGASAFQKNLGAYNEEMKNQMALISNEIKNLPESFKSVVDILLSDVETKSQRIPELFASQANEITKATELLRKQYSDQFQKVNEVFLAQYENLTKKIEESNQGFLRKFLRFKK